MTLTSDLRTAVAKEAAAKGASAQVLLQERMPQLSGSDLKHATHEVEWAVAAHNQQRDGSAEEGCAAA